MSFWIADSLNMPFLPPDRKIRYNATNSYMPRAYTNKRGYTTRYGKFAKRKGLANKGQFRASQQRSTVGTRPTIQRPRGNVPLPQIQYSIMRFSYTFSLATGAAGVTGAGKLVRINDIVQPIDSGATHQPIGYDQMAAIYRQWQVYGCNVQARFTNIGGTHDLCCVMQLRPATGTATLDGANIDQISERADCQTGTISPSGQTRICVLGNKVNVPAMFGRKWNEYMGEEAFSGTASASPAELAFVYVSVCAYDGTASEAVTCTLSVEYKVKWFSLIAPAQS